MSDQLRYSSRITLETVTFVPRRILWLLLLIFILISTDELRLSLAMQGAKESDEKTPVNSKLLFTHDFKNYLFINYFVI